MKHEETSQEALCCKNNYVCASVHIPAVLPFLPPLTPSLAICNIFSPFSLKGASLKLVNALFCTEMTGAIYWKDGHSPTIQEGRIPTSKGYGSFMEPFTEIKDKVFIAASSSNHLAQWVA